MAIILASQLDAAAAAFVVVAAASAGMSVFARQGQREVSVHRHLTRQNALIAAVPLPIKGSDPPRPTKLSNTSEVSRPV